MRIRLRGTNKAVRAVLSLTRRTRRLQEELNNTFVWEDKEIEFLIKLLDNHEGDEIFKKSIKEKLQG